jgi:outer membrane protein OmpA-like peptidoglycan-associated protein
MRASLYFFLLLIIYSASSFAQDPVSDSMPVNLGRNVNSRHAEIAPVISPDGQILYFSRDHYQKQLERTSRRTYRMIMVEYQTIYTSRLDSGKNWTMARKMKEEMNSSEFNALCSISPDGRHMLLYNFPVLYISEKKDNAWGEMREQKIDNFYDSSSFCNFYLSHDGKYLISSVTRQKKRKEDIFVSFLLEPNHWSVPKNLGPAINSFGREISPFLSADNRTLYFSSDSWEGLGEMDIYVSHRHDSSWTDWSPARNLGTPINSEGWDAYFSLPASGDEAYYVSTQSGLGEEDIFKVKLPEWAKPHKLIVVRGKVADSQNDKPLKARIAIEQEENNNETVNLFSDSLTGEFRASLHSDEQYSITVQSEEYLSGQFILKVSADTAVEYKLEKPKGACLAIPDILFKPGQYDISDEASIILSRMTRLLIENHELIIEVIGYTDNSGKKKYNKKLSLLRAKSVKDFLVSKGISVDRITVTAKGTDYPVADNATYEGKKLNRRVELNLHVRKK